MVRTLRLLLPSALVLAISAVSAQNSVDITVVPVQNSDIEVRVRFENDFDGYFAASVFTIRWSEASGANLGAVQQEAQVQEYHDVNASGSDTVFNGYHYKVFAGFGTTVLSDIPLTLMAGEWITLCTIAVSGTDDFDIVNDELTAAINGNYYVSLGGQESQGDIIDPDTDVIGHHAEDNRFRVYPSITSGPFTVEAEFPDADLIALSLENAAGQNVWTSTLSGERGPLRRVMDLSRMADGVYVVRLRTLGGEHVAHVVKR